MNTLTRALRPYPAAGRYLVGVSGGRDSVALLHALTAAGYRRLVVCHLEHNLRGKAGRADARFVERLAAGYALPMEIGRADVPTLAREGKRSLETAAREARYAFFAEAAGRRRCRTLFLAHHADDQAETFLFNLLRGAGPAGLAGMAVESTRMVGRRRLRIVRPLLGIWRAEIDDYLQTHGLAWCEDATNADLAHATRNRLRAEVFPLLEHALGREVRAALWRAADILAAEEAYLSGLLAADGPPAPQLSLAVLAEQPLARQRRVLRAWLLARGVPNVGYREVELVRSLLDKTEGPAKVNLPDGKHARRKQGKLFIDPTHPKKPSKPRSRDL